MIPSSTADLNTMGTAVRMHVSKAATSSSSSAGVVIDWVSLVSMLASALLLRDQRWSLRNEGLNSWLMDGLVNMRSCPLYSVLHESWEVNGRGEESSVSSSNVSTNLNH